MSRALLVISLSVGLTACGGPPVGSADEAVEAIAEAGPYCCSTTDGRYLVDTREACAGEIDLLENCPTPTATFTCFGRCVNSDDCFRAADGSLYCYDGQPAADLTVLPQAPAPQPIP